MVTVARGAHTLGYTVGWRRRVRFDPTARPGVERPGNLLVAGGAGTGKSYCLKQLAARTVRRGERVLVLSWLGRPFGGTSRNEYARVADVVPDSQVVPFGGQAIYTVDPTRIFRYPDDGARYLARAVQILCDVLPDSEEGQRIHHICSWAARRPDSIGRMLGNLAATASQGPSRTATLYRGLAVLPGISAADAIFDNSLPPPLLYGRLVVFDLAPLWDESKDPPLRPLQDALAYLVVAAAVEFCRRDGFAALLIDDAASLALRHPAAWQLVIDQARYSCYHNSAVWVGTADDCFLGFDRPFLDNYFPHRLLFRPHIRGNPNPAYAGLLSVELAEQLPLQEGVWVDDLRRLRHLRVAAADGAVHHAAVV